MCSERIDYSLEFYREWNELWVRFSRGEFTVSTTVNGGVVAASWEDRSQINPSIASLHHGQFSRDDARATSCSDIDCGSHPEFGDYTLTWKPQ